MGHYDLNKLVDYFKIELPQSDLLASFPFENKIINQLRLDSRLIEPNDVFVALQGQSLNGQDFIPQAVEAGAIAILVDTDNQLYDKTISYFSPNDIFCNEINIPQIMIYQLSQKLSAFANDFYDNPSSKMHVVGVTGTNGKTTIAQLIAQWAELLGKKSATLGTLGNGIYNQLKPSSNTTSSSVEIQSYLADFYQHEVKLVAMEVSSHGLALNRVKDISFSASLFTNLSRDHLDFHKTMEGYKQAKWSLFSPFIDDRAVKYSGKKVINFDDEVGQEWIAKLDDVIVVSALPANLPIIRQLGKDYVGVSSLDYHHKGASITIESSFGQGVLESQLYGSFNVSNLLLAFTTLLGLNYSFSELTRTAASLLPVCGRMEVFTAQDKPTIIVDYAHTPDALEKALSAAQTHCQGTLWAIFGCGGDRDNGKRPLMAEVAENYAGKIIVTNDNPRTEDPSKIIQDIITGFKHADGITIVQDRKEAIEYAINQSSKDDVILVAGKGHEDYQIIGKTKHHYSDRETACQLLGIAL